MTNNNITDSIYKWKVNYKSEENELLKNVFGENLILKIILEFIALVDSFGNNYLYFC